jgi:hypothetical protein
MSETNAATAPTKNVGATACEKIFELTALCQPVHMNAGKLSQFKLG